MVKFCKKKEKVGKNGKILKKNPVKYNLSLKIGHFFSSDHICDQLVIYLGIAGKTYWTYLSSLACWSYF